MLCAKAIHKGPGSLRDFSDLFCSYDLHAEIENFPNPSLSFEVARLSTMFSPHTVLVVLTMLVTSARL